MRAIIEQRVVWEGDYFGVHLKVYLPEHVNLPTSPAWLATDFDGEVLLHYSEPTLSNGIWEVESGSKAFGDAVVVAVMEDFPSSFPFTSVLEIEICK